MKPTILIFIFSLFSALFMLNSCNNTVNTKPAKPEESTPAFNLANARKEIEEADRNFMDLFAKGDSVGVANFYTTDGQFMSPGAPAASGRANIQSVMSEILKSGVTRVDIRTKDVYGNEDNLAEVGELSIYVKDKSVGEDKYIVLWKKEDGKWKMFRDIYNTNIPEPAAK